MSVFAQVTPSVIVPPNGQRTDCDVVVFVIVAFKVYAVLLARPVNVWLIDEPGLANVTEDTTKPVKLSVTVIV